METLKHSIPLSKSGDFQSAWCMYALECINVTNVDTSLNTLTTCAVNLSLPCGETDIFIVIPVDLDFGVSVRIPGGLFVLPST